MSTNYNLCRVKRSFKPYQNEHNSVKDTRERSKKPCDTDLKISMKILFHCSLSPNPKILKAFLKTLPTKTKPTKCPAREKKMRQEKRKKKGGEKAESKSQDCCVTFKPKNYRKILLSAHAQTSQTHICIWIRRPRSVRPVNRFVVSFGSL